MARSGVLFEYFIKKCKLTMSSLLSIEYYFWFQKQTAHVDCMHGTVHSPLSSVSLILLVS